MQWLSTNSAFSMLRMELFLRIDFHMKLLLGGAETFHGGNFLVVLGSIILIFSVCTYAYVYVWKLRGQKAFPLVTLNVVSHTTYKQSLFWDEIMRLRLVGETMKPQGTQSTHPTQSMHLGRTSIEISLLVLRRNAVNNVTYNAYNYYVIFYIQ